MVAADRLENQVLGLLEDKGRMKRLDGWFVVQEIRMKKLQQLRLLDVVLDRYEVQSELLEATCKELPLSISPNAVFAGNQDDSFARTYALINPEFRVESFAGYCDPMAVYGDIEPDDSLGFTADRIKAVRDFWAAEEYAQALSKVYESTGLETTEVVYFVEQVTGHTVADFGPALALGVEPLIAKAKAQGTPYGRSMARSLRASAILAERYSALAGSMAAHESDHCRATELTRIAETCARVPMHGARNLYEAMQSFILLWMAMALEQSPNPYAFSVGNLDRILAPFLALAPINGQEAIGLTRHFLSLFCVGDRNWAISQNIMVGGRDEKGNDLTNPMTRIVLEAFRRNNTPQPALSIKLHKDTPSELYGWMEPFFTVPGSVTPSFFNDDVLFDVIRRKGIVEQDLPNYGIAGCQEPLIKGKESGNTTNSWLNLAKVLELTIHGGVSAISGRPIGLGYSDLGLDASNPCCDPDMLRQAFYKHLDYFLKRMEKAANGCTEALSLLPVPFLSAFMGGLETGVDLRDTSAQGTKYNASGCLIHGLSVVADSFAAIDALVADSSADLALLPEALAANYASLPEIRYKLLATPKYGNDCSAADSEAANIASRVSSSVLGLRNPWGNPFLPDWSTPSTHLLYGYWVGATPDGRDARSPLGYGIDPIPGMAAHGLPPRVMSMHSLAYGDFVGGYASHLGFDPDMLTGARSLGMMEALRRYVFDPVFGFSGGKGGFYLYLNVDTAEHLRRILENPKELVPSGIYIMRIHGTFVNFLDLSPAIQEDIINRLDPASTSVA